VAEGRACGGERQPQKRAEAPPQAAQAAFVAEPPAASLLASMALMID